ncbi:F-BAR domain only protein 1 isoform X2 [Anolis carolinensis]|uniref:F-BAR domain only protein 1 isoform X2 n=1 Tax=Anolis carolinensis TaxID=28377 RepID=UPI002F2B725B
MSYFASHFWGEKSHGFEVLYQNMKQGQVSAKELADFVRERAAVEESYAKSMAKMSKLAGSGTQLGTFAPLWEVFRISSDKLALCHLELARRLQDLLRDVGRYAEEQVRTHKKSKEEVSGTLEAVQALAGATQALPKAREAFHGRGAELERLRREGAGPKEIEKAELKSRKAAEGLRRAAEKYNSARSEFERKMRDSAARFQEVEEAHLEQMKALIGSFVHSVEDAHVQVGQVHEEFKQNMENIGVETLLRNFAESKGTGRHPPGPLDFEELSLAPLQEGPKRTRSKAFRIPGLGRKERERDSAESPDAESAPPEVDEEGFTVRPETDRNGPAPCGGLCCSSSDSDFEGDEEGDALPHKFYIRIKPLQAKEQPPPQAPQPQHPSWSSSSSSSSAAAAQSSVEQLKASVGNLVLAPGIGNTVKRHSSRHLRSLSAAGSAADSQADSAVLEEKMTPRLTHSRDPKADPDPLSAAAALFGPPLESAFEDEEFAGPASRLLPSSPSPFSSPSPENVGGDSGLDSPPPAARGPAHIPVGGRRRRGPDPWAPQAPPPRPAPPDPPPPAEEEDGEGTLGGSRPSSHSASSSSSSPAPPSVSSGDSASSPSPWGPPRGRDPHEDTPPRTDPNGSPAVGSVVAPPRRPRSKRPSAIPATCLSSETPRSLSPSPLWSLSAPPSAAERAFFVATQPGIGVSRGPSPVVPGSQGGLPVAAAFTEYVHAFFKGHGPDSCLVKVTGEMTMSFPAGILRAFNGCPSAPVLSFRLLRTAAIDHFLPSPDLLFSDPSQRDPSSRDFWLNMAALTAQLQRQADQAPGAPYYNVTLLRYQFSKQGQSWAPLRLAVSWDCDPEATRVCVDYGYNTAGASAAPPPALTNVQVLLPIEEPADNVRPQPKAAWNPEEKRLQWHLGDLRSGSGRLTATWRPLEGPSRPVPVAAQFSSQGGCVSGAGVELMGSAFRMSLVKKRFATGIYLAGS